MAFQVSPGVNVSEIDLAFKTALINKNYRPDGHYQIIQIDSKLSQKTIQQSEFLNPKT